MLICLFCYYATVETLWNVIKMNTNVLFFMEIPDQFYGALLGK